MGDAVLYGSRDYWVLLAIMLFGRGMDFLSTWIASPNLVLEANPIARLLGWRWGLPLHLGLCVWLAAYPLPVVIVATASVLVASNNFQRAAAMRALGEEEYRRRQAETLWCIPTGLLLGCVIGQTGLITGVGVVLVYFSGDLLIPFGIGLGMIGYATAVTLFTLLSLWRCRGPAR